MGFTAEQQGVRLGSDRAAWGRAFEIQIVAVVPVMVVLAVLDAPKWLWVLGCASALVVGGAVGFRSANCIDGIVITWRSLIRGTALVAAALAAGAAWDEWAPSWLRTVGGVLAGIAWLVFLLRPSRESLRDDGLG